MSIDRSLRTKSSLARHRNVLSRAERVTTLQDEERWPEGRTPLHLPKISHRKSKAGKKKTPKAETAEAAAAATPGAAAPAAPAKAPAKPAAKPAAKPPAK